YAPTTTTEKGLEILREAVDKVSDELGFKIGLGVDVAASSLWDPREKMYVYSTEGRKLTREQQIERVLEYVDRFNLCYVEDPLEEDDFDGFSEIVESLKEKAIVCGDDLIATNPAILREAIKKKSITGLIIKPNQVGFLTRAIEAAEISRRENIVPVVSHRSGEPPEGYLTHLAVAWGGKILKAGIVGGERVAKINELLRIGEEIGFEKIARL
ncbi:MAG: enolase, partial [Nitrososphaerota archaeon]